MHRHSMNRRAAVIAAATALALLPAASALGSGFQLIEQNASGLGNAYAGQAAGLKDASAIYFNPAILTRLDGKQFVLAVNPIGVNTEFTDAGSTQPLPAPLFPVPLGSSGGDAGGWVPVPNAYLSWQAGKQWWLGVGVNVPFGLETDWASDWVGRFHAENSKVQTMNINPTVAFKVTEAFSLGAGANYQKLDATLTQCMAYGGLAVGAAGAVGGPPAMAGILAQIGGPSGLTDEGDARIEGDSWAWGFDVGALLKVGEEGRLGVSYRSRVKHDLEGQVVFDERPTFSTSGPLGALGAGLNARFADGPVTAVIELPDTFSVAAAYEGDRVELLADWTWTGWSSIQDLTIVRADGSGTEVSSVPLRFEDTWRVGLGGNVKLDDKWALRLGVAYDKSPVQDAYRTPRLPDEDRTWIAGGFQWRVSRRSVVDFGYAHLFVAEASSDLPNQDEPGAPPTGNLVGTYNAQVNILSVQYRLTF